MDERGPMQFIFDLRSSGQAHIEIVEGMEAAVHAKRSGGCSGHRWPDAIRADLANSYLARPASMASPASNTTSRHSSARDDPPTVYWLLRAGCRGPSPGGGVIVVTYGTRAASELAMRS